MSDTILAKTNAQKCIRHSNYSYRNYYNYFLSFIFLFVVTIQLANAASINQVEDAAFWKLNAKNYLEKILKKAENIENIKAKNVIIFIGDGMGMTTITAGRIYKGQLNGKSGEEENLVFEDFPNTGLSKTYNVDKQVPDSAGTATAMFSGVKTLYKVVGLDATLSRTDPEKGKLTSIMDWAQSSNKRTGFVTTTRVTHATPASLYANVPHRDWECDSEIPNESKGIFKDIARQLVEDKPGKDLNVIMGGGLSPMGNLNLNEKKTVKFQGGTETICTRNDNRNLTNEWLNLKSNNDNSSMVNNRQFVKTRDELMSIDIEKTEYLMGLFRNNHITYSIARQEGEPSLSEMTEQAIRILNRNDSRGFVLMVEGGRIDQAHHQNYARAALQEVIEMDNAIDAALKMTKRSDTLIIVTADHSHSFTLNGYPKRGNDILGFAGEQNNFKYETLTYANGPGYYEHLNNQTTGENNEVHNDMIWKDLSTEEMLQKRLEPTYRHFAPLPAPDESHGGEDVAVYAIGPGSQLIRGTFEQNYIAYAMSYASCIGPAKDMNKYCSSRNNGSNRSVSVSINSFYYLALLVLFSHLF